MSNPKLYEPFPVGECPRGWPREYVSASAYRRLQKRVAKLERIAKLADELCDSVDRQSEDIGGSRPPLTILRELGPLVST